MKKNKNKKTHAEALLEQGSNNRGVSGGAGGFQFGRGSNNPGRGSSVENQGRRNGIQHRSDNLTEKKNSTSSTQGTLDNSYEDQVVVLTDLSRIKVKCRIKKLKEKRKTDLINSDP